MLTGLSIRDIVLIDRLDLAFPKGLSVLTGETPAGSPYVAGILKTARDSSSRHTGPYRARRSSRMRLMS